MEHIQAIITRAERSEYYFILYNNIYGASTLAIRQKVYQYIIDHTFAEKHKIQDDSLIFKEGYFDSMGFIMLITFLEEEFAISVGDADLIEENFESINAIAAYILRKKNESN